MTKASKPLTAKGLIKYHKNEYASSAQVAYYSEQQQTIGEWHGKLANDFGLSGGVQEEHFRRMANGYHPLENQQLVKPRTTKNAEIAEHVAGWDFTTSAPKSVSATALVGGDQRIVELHREAVKKAMDSLEEYMQVRLPGSKVSTTGNVAIAMFQHDTARPVEGAVDPQLHTHCVVFNMSRDVDGKVRSVNPREMFRVQSYATAVYRSHLAKGLVELGYELERGKGQAFEIKGYTPEYLEAISSRHEQIHEEMAKRGVQGAKISEQIGYETREDKLTLTREEVRAHHATVASEYGNQHEPILRAAKGRSVTPLAEEQIKQNAEAGISFAKHRLLERTAVFDEFEIVRDALNHNMGRVTPEVVKQAFQQRAQTPEFQEVGHHRTWAPGHRYTTPETAQMEQAVLEKIRATKETVPAIEPKVSLADHPDLQDNPMRQKVLEGVLKTTDQYVAIQGAAGSRKSTSLMILKPIVEKAGYEMVAYAPTGGATNELTERGIKADTLQGFLAKNEPLTAKPQYFVLDEASLADTEQIHAFQQRVRPGIDHVLYVGDDSYRRNVGQHKSVGAGRIFREMQESGMKTAELNKMYRQRTPDMKQVASLLRDGKVEEALTFMDSKKMLLENQNRFERLLAIATDYAADHKGAFIVSPDNDSRQQINGIAREALRTEGHLRKDRFAGEVLISRDIYKEDTHHAKYYRAGDVIRYPKANSVVGVKARDYADVVATNSAENLITVRKRPDGQTVTYRADQAKGVQIYEPSKRSFAVGERIQFTDPIKDRGHRLANRDTGTIVKLDRHGNARVRLDKDNGRHVKVNLQRMQHVEYAYAMTSYSLQGKTLTRAILHADTSDPKVMSLLGKDLLYVTGTRGEHFFSIYTDNKEDLTTAMQRECVKPTALSPEQIQEYRKAPQLSL